MPMNPASMMRRLGIKDPRGLQGILSAGAPVYNGGTPQAHRGGGIQYGRPPGSGAGGPPLGVTGGGWNPGGGMGGVPYGGNQPPGGGGNFMMPPPGAPQSGEGGGGFDPSTLTRLVGSLPGMGQNQNSGMGSGINPALLDIIKRRLGAMQGYAG